MQTRNRSWWLAGLIAVIFFVGIYIGKSQSESPATTVAEQPADSAIPPSEAPVEAALESEGEGAVDSESGPGGKNSYRVKGSQATAKTSRPAANNAPRLDTDWEDEYQAEATLQGALDGDEDDAIAVSELVAQCWAGVQTEQQIQSSLARMSQSVDVGNEIPSILIPGTGEQLQFTNFAAYEELTWTRFAQCEATKGMFGNQLRSRLEELALEGSPTARFLYAMWIPRQGSNNANQLVEWVTYQSQAWDFTWQNIREGQPLGLLAYGRSLEQSGAIYFTPRHNNYGAAFIMAAQKCGLDNKVLNQKVGNMTGKWTQRNMTGNLNRAENLSDEIVNMFCR